MRKRLIFMDKRLLCFIILINECYQVSIFLFLQFLQPPFGITCIGIEFQCLLIVADGGIGHMLMLTFPSEDGVFGRQTFQLFVLRVYLIFQLGELRLLTIDDLQFSTDEEFDMWLFNIVTTMDGLVKMV